MAEDWKERLSRARQPYEPVRRNAGARTAIAQQFRRMIQSIIEPGFREAAAYARDKGVHSIVECELGGVQPRAMFCLRPSGRSVRYQLDPDGLAVREIEGVYHRPMGQRKVWFDLVDLQRQLTPGYARAAAVGIVQDELRAARARAERAG
ncbi:MAG TPA: hypothetical protein VFC53_03515 [Dehalococcoidia bacterium]|nr:hypothetical protein [Dehalococcoidia bacterium]